MMRPMEKPLDHAAVVAAQPWLKERDLDCIVSPDSDGLLCGLFMAHHRGWRIRGFYDGRVLAVEKGINPHTCVFLDMEIFRLDVRSIGQHIVHFDHTKRPPHWDELRQCISPNELRGIDINRFREKYPLGTIHALMALIHEVEPIQYGQNAFVPLLYTDGTFKNLLNYPENCLSWFRYLGFDSPQSKLHSIFYNKLTVIELMTHLRDFFDAMSAISGGKSRVDKIRLMWQGRLVNVVQTGDVYKLSAAAHARAIAFMALLAQKTGWHFDPAAWSLSNLVITTFPIGSVEPTAGEYTNLMAKRPLSLAITGLDDKGMQFTLDPNGVF